MTDENLPRAIWEGTLSVFGATVNVCVLDDGRRIIDEAGFAAILDTLGESPTMNDTHARDVHRLASFVNGKGIPDPEPESRS